jgi:RNA polymerase sigma-70 factor (family 1)
MNYVLLSDEELKVRVNLPDTSAFEEIYNRYWLALYNKARWTLQDDDEAADVVQDVFSSMFENMGKIKFYDTLPAYLFRALNNRTIDLFRRSKLKDKYLDSFRDFLDRQSVATDSHIRETEMASLIQKEIDALPPKMREIFNLSRKSYLSNKEIAKIVDISEATVKKHLQVAVKKLRARLTLFFFFYLMVSVLWISRLL